MKKLIVTAAALATLALAGSAASAETVVVKHNDHMMMKHHMVMHHMMMKHHMMKRHMKHEMMKHGM